MNIDSVQTSGAPQRPAAAERQAKTVAPPPQSSSKIAQVDQNRPESENRQLTVQEAVKHLEHFVSLTSAGINFTIDEASGVQVVKITDRQSKEVIRQFPSEEAIRIAQVLDQLQGVFVRDKA